MSTYVTHARGRQNQIASWVHVGGNRHYGAITLITYILIAMLYTHCNQITYFLTLFKAWNSSRVPQVQ